MGAPKIPIQDRFWLHTDTSLDGCWPTDYTPSQVYGTVKVEGQWVKAHRVSYELTYGPVPDGAIVLHRCDNPRCVRPDHLSVGTHKDNSQDMSRKGRAAGQNKTHCKRGHQSWGVRSGRRFCKECDSLARKERYSRIVGEA